MKKLQGASDSEWDTHWSIRIRVLVKKSQLLRSSYLAASKIIATRYVNVAAR